MTKATKVTDRIWLTGLMGSGKSTVGRALADRLGCRYVDNDETITELAGQSTVAMAEAGGNLLHDWEARYVGHVAALPPPLVAGIPASAADRAADMALLDRAGLIVYLRCDLDTLVHRVLADGPRPWLGGHPERFIAKSLAARDPALTAAARLVADGNAPVAAVTDQIAAFVTAGQPGLSPP